MTDSQIDDAILAVTESSWKKVAMIILRTVKKLGGAFPDTEGGHVLVASRIDALVRDGRLEAQGDLKYWRFSEIRRPN